MSNDNKVSILSNSLLNKFGDTDWSGVMIVKVDPGDHNSIVYTQNYTGVDALGPQTLIVDKDDIVFKETGGFKLSNQKDLETRKEFKNYSDSHIQEGDSKVLNNPITAAFESTLGKGLAGFITMLDVNYQDQLWETAVEGSKAPKVVKISINFAPLHDIPPGLDADGAMRAPVYNAGKIINTIYGDVYDK
jgi:hypothetical protein